MKLQIYHAIKTYSRRCSVRKGPAIISENAGWCHTVLQLERDRWMEKPQRSSSSEVQTAARRHSGDRRNILLETN